jgi:D-beta-D-heptose 7-phosphate kinase/D-beta-D-heptose 1-phosphate adenosyltransferase
VLAAMLAAGADFEPAVRAANAAAAVVVGKRGTATASIAELRARILPAASRAPEEKIIFDWAMLDERLAQWRRQGLRIGFTNGCFDLLHPGHVKVLAEARAACDRLVVGLNSDVSVARIKGPGRPLELIRRVQPKVLVKGGDYRRDQVVGREVVEAAGGEVILVETLAGHSTTELVGRTRKPGAP